MNFFETFPEFSLPSTVSKNIIETIGHHSRLRDVMGHVESSPYLKRRGRKAFVESLFLRS